MWGQTGILCCVLAATLAATATGPLPPKPEKFKDVEGCYIEELDAVVPAGEAAASRTSCLQYRCHETSVSYVGCPALDAGPGVKVVHDKSKPYPGCCPRFENLTINTK